VKKVSILALTALVVALAVPTLASNTGFKLNYPLTGGNRNLVSLPYFYFPTGDITSPEQNARNICMDLSTGGCAITQVIRYVKTGSVLAPSTHPCVAPVGGFVYTPGEAILVNATADCTADIVGSHDDNYSVGGTESVTITQGNNNVSVPYHVQANNARELCLHLIADNPPVALTTLVRVTAFGPLTHPCAGPVAGFPITPGEGYFIVPTGSLVSFDIQWRTF